MGRDNEKPEVISRLAVLALCGSRDGEDKREIREIVSISSISGGWRHGIGRELKQKAHCGR